MPVRAPYAFVPLSDKVFFPEWADLVSHDVPFKDGWCGEIEIEIRTCTPLVVGAERKVQGDGSGEVRPYKLPGPDGRYAIPGSSLQGVIRNVLEIATFGRMASPPNDQSSALVEERRFGIRNPDPSVREIYLDRILKSDRGNPRPVTYHVKAGWLQQGQDGKWRLTPCSYARVPFGELKAKSSIEIHPTGQEQAPAKPPRGASRADWRTYDTNKDAFDAAYEAGNFWARASTAEERTKWWTDTAVEMYVGDCWRHTHNRHRTPISIPYRRASFDQTPPWALPGDGTFQKYNGTLVLTGKMSHGYSAGDKKQEWFFYDDPTAKKKQELLVPPDVRRDFEAIHWPDEKNNRNPNWAYWRDKFEAGKKVPIFWLWDNPDPGKQTRVDALGTALLMKLPHKRSTHEMVSEEHRCALLDFPTVIFGAKADNGAGLRRRISFGEAVFDSIDDTELGKETRILLGPKPSYYPCYVRQATPRPGNRLCGHEEQRRGGRVWVIDEPYATYTPVDRYNNKPTDPAVAEPRLAGWKQYPARLKPEDANVPAQLAGSPQLHTRLSTLPANKIAKAIVPFHNMRSCELGGVVWALTWGCETSGGNSLRHRIGMGKAFGLGQIEIRITRVKAFRNDRNPEDAKDGCIEKEDVACESVTRAWVKDFIALMDGFIDAGEGGWRRTEQVETLLAMADPAYANGRLTYMELADFAAQKRGGYFLPPYPTKPAPTSAGSGGGS